MKIRWFILVLSLSCHFLNVQAQGWTWGKSGANTAASLARSVATDPAGNIYVLGEYSGSITFESITLTTAGTNGLYVVKYSPNGSQLWAASIKSMSGKLYCNAITADVNGEVYLAGEFDGSILFDTTQITSVGEKDIFLAKLSADGTFAWGKTHGTIWDEEIRAGISIDSKHNIIVAGAFCGVGGSPPQKESINFDGHILTSQGNRDIFITKYDSSGKVLWAKDIGTKSREIAFSSIITPKDKILVVGIFDYKLKIDSLPELVSVSSGFVVADCFVAEFDSNGNALWANVIGGRRPVGGHSGGAVIGKLVTSDKEGNVIIGGLYTNCDVLVDSVGIPPTDYDVGTYDIWFAKYDSSGNFKWVKTAKSINPELLNGLTTDNDGNIYLTGYYGYGCVFDTITAVSPATASAYLFVAEYTGSGDIKWLSTMGGTDGAVGQGIAMHPSGYPVVAGTFFDPSLKVGPSLISNNSTANGFVARMGAPTAIKGPVKNFNLEVYPNPATNLLNVRFDQEVGLLKFRLFDALGQLLVSGTKETGNYYNIHLPVLPSGIYYLQLSGAMHSCTRKVFIQQQ